jgi:hypothetical protein
VSQRSRVSTSLVLFTATYTVVSILAFAAAAYTRDFRLLHWFFQVPGALALICLPAGEAWLAWKVSRSFGAGEPLRRAWVFICLSAACAAAGALYSQVVGTRSPLNPFTGMANWSQQSAADLRQTGLVLGGTFRFALLACGLYFATTTYRRAGLLGKLRLADRLLMGCLAVYVVLEFRDLALAMQRGRRPDVFEIMMWPVDPLLWVLVGQALLVLRSVRGTGMGWIGRCWTACAAAVLATLAGDVGLWFVTRGYLPWPWSSLTWFIWLPAAGAFALAPAYQWEAIQHALGADPRKEAVGSTT